MVGYLLGNTVTEHGHVARGICEEDENNYLLKVTEHTHIEKMGADARYTEDDGKTWTEVPGSTIVSMNLWGFTNSFLKEAEGPASRSSWTMPSRPTRSRPSIFCPAS